MKRVYLIRQRLPDFAGSKQMCIGSTDIPMGGKKVLSRQSKWRSTCPLSPPFFPVP